MKRRDLLLACVAAGLGGCTLAPTAARPAMYDLGIEPPPVPARPLRARVALAEVSASAWLQTPAIVYRLAYDDPAQVRVYALSRWAAAPAELIEQRLRQALGQAAGAGFSLMAEGLPTDYLLRIHLETFEQVVDTPSSSRALVRLRARLTSADRKARAQHVFESQQPCASVDAVGSVHALGTAADAAIARLVEWLGAQTES